MRVAALYDIHGNLPALEAVMADVRRVGVDRVVVGGDVCPGPMSREVLDYLREADLPMEFLQGNGDRETLAMREGKATSVPEAFRESVRWCGSQLRDTDVAFIQEWPATLRLDIDDTGSVLFCHATPRNDVEIFTANTPDAVLRPIFDDARADVVVCGHTHMQFDRFVGRTRVVNAGSVGMPFGEPGACWLLLGESMSLRRTTYDLEAAAARVRGTGYPHADFAAAGILTPPTERDMLASFSKAELRS